MEIKKDLLLTYFDVAEAFAKLSHCSRTKVGALVVKNGSILAHGWNGTPSKYPTNVCEKPDGTTDPYVLHAEQNLIVKMAKSTESMQDCAVFCTHSPCQDCAKLLAQIGIKAFYYIHDYRDTRGLDVLNMLGVVTRKKSEID
jgi:dCMP deaminase